jgi:uncharacterized membrane protein
MLKKMLFISICTLPALVFAAPSDFKGLVGLFTTGLVNPIIKLLTGIAVLFFIWGIVKYIASAGNAEEAKKGKSIMVYGVIALFVLSSFWGIVQFFYQDIFG